MDSTILVDVTDATDRQILVALYGAVQSLESTVSELSTAVADLKASVADLGTRVQGQLAPLQEALAAAQQSLADFTVADDIEDADFRAQIAQLQSDLGARVDEAIAATESIASSIGDINRVAAPEPGGPGDESGQDNGEPPIPDEGDGAHVDNTLPGDLPHPEQQ